MSELDQEFYSPMPPPTRSDTTSPCPIPALDSERRFGGISRVYGSAAGARLRASAVTVIGLGGVGSWCVEALARSAVGRLRIVDLDNVAESNSNRQIHALDGAFGKPKVQALAERVSAINPLCAVEPVDRWLETDNVPEIVGAATHFVIDCTDQFRAKAGLAAYCVTHRVPLITIGAAGGQIDPLRIRRADITQARQDRLLARVRATLRREFGFPRAPRQKFGIPCVYSEEPIRYPDGNGGVQYARPPELPASGLGCAGAYGSVMTVTCSFAMVATAYVLDKLAEQ